MPHHLRAALRGPLALAFLSGALLAACGGVRTAPAHPTTSPVAAAPAVVEKPSTYVVIRVKARRLELMQAGVASPLGRFPIAVGRGGHETPTGRFQVEEMVEHPDFLQIDPKDPTRVLKRIPPGPENPLGERWIGFAHGDGWTIGMHGTPHPELLGRAVSGGCIRMRNADVLYVYERVTLGTPVIVKP